MHVSAEALRAHLDYSAWASMRLVEAAGKLTPEELTRDYRFRCREPGGGKNTA